MLLEQFINSMAIGPGYTLTNSNTFKMKCTDGVIHKFSYYSSSLSTSNPSSDYVQPNDGASNVSSTLMSKIGIIVGNGTTPPTFSDYKMENPLKDTLTFSNNAVSIKARVQVLTQSVTNPTSETVTINEVGVYGYTDPGCYLLTRSIISPVTLAPSETKTFTIKIDYNKFSDAYSAS